jgi:hypothetical protein
VVGLGSDDVEARIFYFGVSQGETSEALREMLLLSGEVAYADLPKRIHILEKANVQQWPAKPDAPLQPGEPLSSYLRRTCDVSPAADRVQDEVNGRPFRVLEGIRSPLDLPARLSGPQKEMLHTPKPLLIQGPAGSGKTTLLVHIAHELAQVGDLSTKVLVIAYTEELKAFIQRYLKALESSALFPTKTIEVLTWRQLCDSVAEWIGILQFNGPLRLFSQTMSGSIFPKVSLLRSAQKPSSR